MCSAPTAAPSSLRFTGPDKGDWVSLALDMCPDCGARLAKHLKRGIPRWSELRQLPPDLPRT